jgi:hypothetical protein
MRARYHGAPAVWLAFAIELALFGNALERFARALDAILVFIAFRRQQLDDLERAARTEAAEGAGGVAYVLADRIFVSFQQRTPPHTRTAPPPRPAMNVRSEYIAVFPAPWCEKSASADATVMAPMTNGNSFIIKYLF